MSSAPSVIPSAQMKSNPILQLLEWAGDLGLFAWRVLRAAVSPPYEIAEFWRQLDNVGAKSLPLVAAAGGAIGVVLALGHDHALERAPLAAAE